MVWTKEEQREYMKQYYKVNKAKIKEQQKQYSIDNREKRREQKKQYRKDNIAKIKEQQKQWYKDTIEQRMQYYIENKEQKKQYNIENHERETINSWKRSGLIHPDYNALYDRYINTHHCDICNCEFNKNNCRCMDHDHSNGLFRQILCMNCNRKDNWIKVLKKINHEKLSNKIK